MGLRVLLFVGTNLAIMFIFFLFISIFNLEQNIGKGSTEYILFKSLIFGFGGSIISLLISKWSAKRIMNVHIIEKDKYSDENEKWFFETVEKLAKKAGIDMPEVGFYEGEANAFATGPSRNNALVAISTGLYRNMDSKEVEAVLAHEIGHVANGDMVTLTMLQGVVNTFVIFFARIFGTIIDKKLFNNQDGKGIAYTLISIILEIVFSILASMIVMWFSRYREFRADEMGAKLAGKENMMNALRKLGNIDTQPLPEKMVSMGIAGGTFAQLFSTHPTIQKRLENLKKFKS